MTILGRTISAILIAALTLLGNIGSGNAAGGSVLDPQGLMYNLTLEGSKISRMR